MYEIVSLGIIIFVIGLLGVILNRRNIIILLMSLELMILAINMMMIGYSVLIDDIVGQLFTFMLLTVAAGESAIGLSIIVAYYRVRGTIAVMYMNLLKG